MVNSSEKKRQEDSQEFLAALLLKLHEHETPSVVEEIFGFLTTSFCDSNVKIRITPVTQILFLIGNFSPSDLLFLWPY